MEVRVRVRDGLGPALPRRGCSWSFQLWQNQLRFVLLLLEGAIVVQG